MKTTITGKLERVDLGVGACALKTPDHKTYELQNVAPELGQSQGKMVSVTGVVRDDVMSIAMIGPVLVVESFTVVG